MCVHVRARNRLFICIYGYFGIVNQTLDSNIDFADDQRLHGEDVVPLERGPVPPTAPNPTTEDASGHP